MPVWMIPVMIFLPLVIGAATGIPAGFLLKKERGKAIGKYFGARLGAKATGMPMTVQKYLGLTLLPHSGVSLVFTGIAVSTLSASAPDCAKIIQGTIAAAAVINEIIAVIIAKKGFEWAGEFNKA